MEDNIKNIVASNLVNLRKSKNMTQSDVAKALNYTDKSVSKWEHADSLPDISILNALCKIYGVTLDYLVQTDPEEQKRHIVDTQAEKSDRKNKIVLVLMSIAVTYLVATIIFVYSTWMSNGEVAYWQPFLWAVPVCAVMLLGFNYRWFKNVIVRVIFQTIFVWSTLFCVYLQFIEYQFWLIFILGIPLQIMIILNTQLKRNR